MIEVRGLTRRFGTEDVLRAIDFDVPAGSVCGFIGPNGAGKTTTMRILSTLDVANSGSALIDGIDVALRPDLVRQRIGYMPDYYGTYPDLTAREYLDFFARAFRVPPADRPGRIEEITAFTEVGPLLDKPIDGLSKGQKQRLSLARVLLSDPALLILDEPAAGLDPQARVELRELIQLLAEAGKTIFISSHILSELAELVTWLVIIDRGLVRYCGKPDGAHDEEHSEATYVVALTSELQDAQRFLLEQPAVLGVEAEESTLLVRVDIDAEPADALIARMIGAGIRFEQFYRRTANLEDVFMKVTARSSDAPPG
ncbi:MAG: ABC transporter ATP-binding protein [Myxococcales bacterium]|nr:ABC transporter ATP-binding protein [Myxococcales bacterium]